MSVGLFAVKSIHLFISNVHFSVCHLSVCLSIWLSDHLIICISVHPICLFVHLHISPSVHLSIFTFVILSICPSVHLSICSFVYLSICRSENPFISPFDSSVLLLSICRPFIVPTSSLYCLFIVPTLSLYRTFHVSLSCLNHNKIVDIWPLSCLFIVPTSSQNRHYMAPLLSLYRTYIITKLSLYGPFTVSLSYLHHN